MVTAAQKMETRKAALASDCVAPSSSTKEEIQPPKPVYWSFRGGWVG